MCIEAGDVTKHCRSEPAREGRKTTAGNQTARVIVDVHREQARSYRESAVCIDAVDVTKHCGSGLARDDGKPAPTRIVRYARDQAVGKLGASTAPRLRWIRKYAP
ncbi:hypothetical protein D3C81_1907330 [compost metagenome]